MKKYLFFFFQAATLCLLLSGCNSDNDVDSADAEAPEVTFYADYGMDSDLLFTRTVMDASGSQFWNLTDTINVNGLKSIRTALPEGRVYAAFTVAATSPYYAFYPGDATDLQYNNSTNLFTYNFPATQAYNESHGYLVSDGVNPMVATGINPYLSFYNVCGILKANIQANVGGVSKIRFLSADEVVAGSAIVNPVKKTLTVTGTTLSMDVIFSSPRTLTTNSSLTVCWVLPTGTYGTGWQIQFLDAGGSILMKKIFTSSITVSRGKITGADIWL